MNPPRVPDWRERLDLVIRDGRTALFGWGRHDCLAFPAKGITAVTGVDVFQPYRGRYSDEPGALALVPDMEAMLMALAAEQGWQAIQGRAARRGDLGVITVKGRRLGALAYDGWLVARQKGYTRFPLRAAGLAWSVGSH